MVDHRAAASVEAVFREERGRLLAVLAARFGDLDLAEEAASEALEAALVHWPHDGVPSRPLAWLVTTAKRKAIDRIRRDRNYAERLAVLQVETDRTGPVPEVEPGDDVPDSGCSCSSPAATRRCRSRPGRR